MSIINSVRIWKASLHSTKSLHISRKDLMWTERQRWLLGHAGLNTEISRHCPKKNPCSPIAGKRSPRQNSHLGAWSKHWQSQRMYLKANSATESHFFAQVNLKSCLLFHYLVSLAEAEVFSVAARNTDARSRCSEYPARGDGEDMSQPHSALHAQILIFILIFSWISGRGWTEKGSWVRQRLTLQGTVEALLGNCGQTLVPPLN